MKKTFALLAIFFLQACVREIPPVVVDYPPVYFEALDSIHVEQRLTRHMSGRVEHVFYVYQDSSTGKQVMHGPDIEYYLDGNRKVIQYWRKGKLFGPATFWFDNGNISGISHYRNGVMHGIARAWYEDGTLQSMTTWNMGKLDGWQRNYDKQGKLISAHLWQNNQILKQTSLQTTVDTASVLADSLRLQPARVPLAPIDSAEPPRTPVFLPR